MQTGKSKNHQKLSIGVDLMGGSTPPLDLLKTIATFLAKKQQEISVVFFGSKELQPALENLYSKFPSLVSITSFVPAEEVITMNDNPLVAIRKKKESSLCIGIKHVKQEFINAFISCGNTGALLALSRRHLPRYKAISRPGLVALLPTKEKPMAVVDVGAGVNSKAEHLLQFAKLGIAFTKAMGIITPRIGLLNVGTEALKGTSEVQKAYIELSKRRSDQCIFCGNIEGKDAFNGDIDLLITDGFTGNVFLKTSEGIANLVVSKIQEKFTDNEALFLQELHCNQYPGALLLGVDAMIIKCHGYSSAKTFVEAIEGAASMLQSSLPSKMKTFFDAL